MEMYIVKLIIEAVVPCSCTVYIGVDEIGASVKLDILAHQLVHFNQSTPIPSSLTFLGAGAADASLCVLLFTGSYAQ